MFDVLQRHRTLWCPHWKFSTRGSSGSTRLKCRRERSTADRRQRRQCRHRAPAAGRSAAGCRPPLDRRAMLPQRRVEETGLAAGVAQPSHAAAVAWLARSHPMDWRWKRVRWYSRDRSSDLSRHKGDTIQADYGAYGSVSWPPAAYLSQETGHAAYDRIFRQSRRARRYRRGRGAGPQRRGADRRLPPGWHPRPRDQMRALRDCRRPKNYGFLDMVLRQREGRDLTTTSRPATYLQYLGLSRSGVRQQQSSRCRSTLQINDKETSWKRSNIHDALKVETTNG